MTDPEQHEEQYIVNVCRKYRTELKGYEDSCRMLSSRLHNLSVGSLHGLSVGAEGLNDTYNIHEAKSQMNLAYRHLEDARMRLGKVIQYGENQGKSCCDTD